MNIRSALMAALLLSSALLSSFPMSSAQAALDIQPSASGGFGHSVLLKSDGSVWSWGLNEKGELGIGNNTNSYDPKRISPSYFNNETVARVETAAANSIALTTAGNVYTWGTRSTSPVKKTLSFSASQVETGANQYSNTYDYYYALNPGDGSIWAWGDNTFGELGNGLTGFGSAGGCATGTIAGTPKQILTSATVVSCNNGTTYTYVQAGSEVPLTNVRGVSVGVTYIYSLAVTNANEVYMWGTGLSGYTAFAQKNPNLTSLSAVKVDAGPIPILLTASGQVYTWSGVNGTPNLITLENETDPVVDVTSGNGFILFLTSGGKVYGLGDNSFSQLGNLIPSSGVSTSGRLAKFTGFSGVSKIGAGSYHTLLQMTDGTLETVGRNSYGQLANTSDSSRTTFTSVAMSQPIKAVHANFHSSYAVDASDTLYEWGSENVRGGTLIASGRSSANLNVPGAVKSFTSDGGVVRFNESMANSYLTDGLLTGNGKFYVWGDTWRNETGGVSRSYDNMQPLANFNSALNGSNFTVQDAIQTSGNGVMVNTDGDLYTWGPDYSCALGMGSLQTEINSNGATQELSAKAFQKPVQPSGIKFSRVFGSNNTMYALSTDGDVYSWGSNGFSVLGYSAASGYSCTMTKISTLPKIKKIARGVYHVLALDVNGSVWAWGDNRYGELGIGNTVNKTSPSLISGLSQIQDIAAGDYDSFAIDSNGTAFAWGDNRYGQLGLGDRIDRNAPRQIPMSNVKMVDGAKEHTLLLTTDGKVFSAGSDFYGKLGLGQVEGIATPEPVVFVPVVTLTTANNQNLTQGQTLTLAGNVYTETAGAPMTITYTIQGPSGTKTGTILNYTSTTGYTNFSYPVTLDGSFPQGGYTVVVTAQANTGISGTNNVNFGITDTIAPTLSADVTSQTWSASPASVTLTAADTGGSGYRGINYAWSSSSTKPSSGWSGIVASASVNAVQNQSGIWYLHAESYDNAGNSTYNYYGPYRVDNTGPVINVTYPSGWQQESLTLSVSVNDPHSGLSNAKWINGIVDAATVKANGSTLDFTTKTLTDNQSLTFYAEDNLGNNTLQTVTVSNINKTPVLSSLSQTLLLPVTDNAVSLSGTYSDPDQDPLSWSVKKDGVQAPLIGASGSGVDIDIQNETTNAIHNWSYFLTDGKGGNTASYTLSFERYDPAFRYTASSPTSLTLSWNQSKLAQMYHVKRNGVTIYDGTLLTYTDTTLQPDTTYTYELWADYNGISKLYGTFTVNSGSFSVDVPTNISLPAVQLGMTVQDTSAVIGDITIGDTTLAQTNWKLMAYADVMSSRYNRSIAFPSGSLSLSTATMKIGSSPQSYAKTFILDSGDVEVMSAPLNVNGQNTELSLTTPTLSLRVPPMQRLAQESDGFDTTIHWTVQFTP